MEDIGEDRNSTHNRGGGSLALNTSWFVAVGNLLRTLGGEQDEEANVSLSKCVLSCSHSDGGGSHWAI